MGPGYDTGMLEHPDDDTRRDPLFIREGADVRLASRGTRDKLLPGVARNERVSSPLICLGLVIGSSAIGPVNKDALLAVKQKVCRLVKQAEPEMIVRLMPCTQLDHGFSR